MCPASFFCILNSSLNCTAHLSLLFFPLHDLDSVSFFNFLLTVCFSRLIFLSPFSLLFLSMASKTVALILEALSPFPFFVADAVLLYAFSLSFFSPPHFPPLTLSLSPSHFILSLSSTKFPSQRFCFTTLPPVRAPVLSQP